MPVFTSIGLAVGATAATAFAVGVGATALATGVGLVAYGAGGGFDSSGDVMGQTASRVADSRTETGALTPEEAALKAKSRAYRSGVLFTSPTGLDSVGKTSSAKLR